LASTEVFIRYRVKNDWSIVNGSLKGVLSGSGQFLAPLV